MNEMLEYTSPKFQLAFLKLLNFILSVGYFPDIWNHGLTAEPGPEHEKDKDDDLMIYQKRSRDTHIS